LIIGILAAIAIPSFLNQKGKAVDAAAKELAHSAQVAAETIATDSAGSYALVSPTLLNTYENTIRTAQGGGNAYVSTASGNSTGYTILVLPATGGEQFTIARNGGVISRTCTPATGVN